MAVTRNSETKLINHYNKMKLNLCSGIVC